MILHLNHRFLPSEAVISPQMSHKKVAVFDARFDWTLSQFVVAPLTIGAAAFYPSNLPLSRRKERSAKNNVGEKYRVASLNVCGVLDERKKQVGRINHCHGLEVEVLGVWMILFIYFHPLVKREGKLKLQ